MRHTWWLVVAALAACGPSSFGDFRTQLVKAACDRDVKCGLVAASERDRCPPPDAILSYAATVPAASADAELKAHLLAFNSSGAEDCLDAVRGAACRYGNDPAAPGSPIALHCHHVVGPNVTVGKACQGVAECLGGTCVSSTADVVGTCVAYPSPGAPCTDQASCDPTVQFCGLNPSTEAGAPPMVCLVHKQPGQKCDADEQCSFGYLCSPKGVCASPAVVPDGSACVGGANSCKSHSSCRADGLCHPLEKLGAACAERDCQDGLACVGLTLDASGAVTANGTCARFIDAGQACTAGPTVTGCAASDTCAGGVCTLATP